MPCERCVAVYREYRREYNREYRRGVRRGRPEAVCGTPSGHRRHRRLGEAPCARCVEACAVYKRELRYRRNVDVDSPSS